jgi:beta-lactamase regulating signal transducer with metallopeptidase domain
MITAWMIYGLVVGALVAIAAVGAEQLLRVAARPTRWLWVAALVLTTGATLLAPLRGPSEPLRTGVRLALSASDAVPSPAPPVHRWSLHAVTAQVEQTFASIAHATPRGVERGVGILWLALSGAALLVFLGVYARFRRARLRWPRAELAGSTVRLAPQAGPAVVGLADAEIVVPHWLLRRSSDEQRLVVAHEREHLRAGDPWLLAVGCCCAVLLPWHPAVWWLLARLRLGVELDCDRRVLAGDVNARTYGSLLIDLASRGSSLHAGALALADTPSHLERRLLAMTARPGRLDRVRASVLGAIAIVAVGALVVACDSGLPTSADVDRMDVASASRAARLISLGGAGPGTTIYLVDGKRVTAAQANALSADSIASIRITKARSARDSASIVILTRGSAMRSGKLTLALRDSMPHLLVTRGTPAGKFNGLLMVDGVQASAGLLQSLAPDSIATVEVVKGPTAMRLYAQPAARNGVILITTKRARP